MEINFAILRSENVEHLCYKVDAVYVDVSNPMMTFIVDEDEFEVVIPDYSFMQKEYEFRGERYYLVPRFYGNGWLALTLAMVEDEQEFLVLSVNLRRSGFVEYPMAMLNLPLLYQHNPQSFQNANVELFG